MRSLAASRRNGQGDHALSNIIGYPQRQELPELNLEDRKLHILCSVLALASCSLCTTPSQRDIAFFFSSRDLRVLGAGMGGFDLGELPWGDKVEADQQYLDRVCNAALRGAGWERLNYYPDTQWLLPAIEFFRQLVSQFRAEHIGDPDPTLRDLRLEPILHDQRPDAEERCARHKVYLHRHGCLLC